MDFHLQPAGAYFVTMVLYCCFYKESADKVKMPADQTKLTPDQDTIYKGIAWDTVRTYKWAGVTPLPAHE